MLISAHIKNMNDIRSLAQFIIYAWTGGIYCRTAQLLALNPPVQISNEELADVGDLIGSVADSADNLLHNLYIMAGADAGSTQQLVGPPASVQAAFQARRPRTPPSHAAAAAMHAVMHRALLHAAAQRAKPVRRVRPCPAARRRPCRCCSGLNF